MDRFEQIHSLLADLYGDTRGLATFERVRELARKYQDRIPTPRQTTLLHSDSVLITYGDQVKKSGETPLQTLSSFCQHYLSGRVGTVHILPFYPYTSDDGFSVVDYQEVDPALGSWEDISQLGEHFQLMFDAVINHISAHSLWFKSFCSGDPNYSDFFIAVPEDADLSQVIRPRTLPLLTSFHVEGKMQKIWTTFSADQVDLNYANPLVLLQVLDTLLFYVEKGAQLIRLDAIAFLWKTYGTTCLHLPQTHWVIQIIRALIDQVAPHVKLITETNVPHDDNLSYFGDGSNEAQMVYNFALPPLVMHTLQSGDASILMRWAADLVLPSKQTTFFNFLASHDGIGLNPARGILSQAQIDALVARTQANGGLVSYKNNPDGSTSPYELNINYFDALNDPSAAEPLDLQVARFMASQAIMLSMVGVPGIYFHSLLGSRSWREGVNQTGHNRTINRQKFNRIDLDAELRDPHSLRSKVFSYYSRLLRARASQKAFDPYGDMKVIDSGKGVFVVLRSSKESPSVLCLQNITDQPQCVDPKTLALLGQDLENIIEIISGNPLISGEIVLTPYQSMWLVAQD